MNLGQNPFGALVDFDELSTTSSSSCSSHTKVQINNTFENYSQAKKTLSTPSANSSTNLCKYQQKLFTNLESLKQCSSMKRTSCFVSKDVEFHGSTYRIYNYKNLTRYSDFNQPAGLECRGHMFEMDVDSMEPIRLACLPPEKFFNINENPFTENLDFRNPKQIMIKEDGSLISTFLHNGELYVKSKGSLESSQAIDSMAFLSRPVNSKFESELHTLEEMGYTVNLEYVGPQNRVLLPYQDERLIPLSIRNRENGKYLDKDQLDPKIFPEVINRWVKQLDVSNLDMDTFIQNCRYEKSIEGYVIQLASGQFCKAKTEYYLDLSHPQEIKGKKLFICVLNDKIDDIKGLWSEDKAFLDRVDKYENTVMQLLHESKQGIEHFYEENHWMMKHFDNDARKLRKRWYSNAKKAFQEEWLRKIAMKRLEIEIDSDQWNDELKKVWNQVEYKFLD